MISRKQLVDAYQSSEHIIRRKLKATGIQHRYGLSLEEFREFMKKHGWPINKNFDDIAQRAIKSPIQLNLPL